MALRMGTKVRVVQAIDQEIYDVSDCIGRLGKVVRVTHELPAEWQVRLTDGRTESFWCEELEELRALHTRA